jgi:hypothetical protein
MRIQSPVGEFPVTLVGVSAERGAPKIDMAMGAWRSRVSFDRGDYPLLVVLAAAVLLVFLAGRRSAC